MAAILKGSVTKRTLRHLLTASSLLAASLFGDTAPIGSPPSNTVLPVIIGTAQEGETLTATSGTWTGSPTLYEFQWNQDGTPIAGATSGSYLIVTADVGHTLSVTVTATNGYGSDVATSSSTDVVVAAPAAVPLISPAVAWNGTAGSGYAGSPPVQTGTAIAGQPYVGFMHGTIAANLNWIFHENFYPDGIVTNDVTIMVDGGDFDDALEVTLYVEGSQVVQTSRVLVDLPAITGYVGSTPTFGTKQVAAYAATLDHSAFASNGAIDIYAKAHSSKVGVADRVIGPVRLFRRVDLGDGKLGYDVQKTIGTGGDYATLAAALAGHTTWWTSGQVVRLKYLNDATIDPSINAFLTSPSATKDKRGTVVVDANGFNIVGLRSTGNPNLHRALFNGLVYKGIKFDLSNVTQLYQEDGTAVGTNDGFRPLLLIRCEVYGGGKSELAGGTSTVSNANAKTTRGVSAWRPEVGRLSTFVRDMHTGDNQSFIETGSYQARTGGDLHLIGSSIHRAAALFYNVYEDCDVEAFRAGTAQFTLYYTGAGTPGYRTTGAWNNSARKFILTVNGADVDAGVTLSTTFGTGVYSSLDLVNAINSTYGASGWVATSVADTYRAVMVGQETSTAVQPVGTSAGTATTVNAYAWLHMDGHQFSSSDNHDNHTIMGQELRGVSCQTFFPSVQTNTASSYNCLIRNNVAMLNDRGNANSGAGIDVEISQIAGDHFNFLMDNNTVPNQGFVLRLDGSFDTDLDSFSSIRDNVFKFMGMITGAAGATNSAFIQRNVNLMPPIGGYLAVAGTNVSGNIDGATTPLAEFPDVDNLASTLTRSSWSPAAGGVVRSNPQTPVTKVDLTGAPRGASGLAGALST